MQCGTLTIDEFKITYEQGMTVLQAALAADIYIPHLCHHPDLPDVGECKMCVVEIKGREGVCTACTTPAEDGMEVLTKTERLRHLRMLSMELMLASHPSECISCPKYLKCELQNLIQYLGVSDTRLRKMPMTHEVQTENPLFIRDMNRCVLCGRCVRACRELRGCGVLSYQNVDGEVTIGGEKGGLLADDNCRFCCACVEACPTGALRDKDEFMSAFPTRKENLLPCRAGCPAGTDVPRYIRYIKEGKYPEAVAVVRERVPFPLTLGHVCMAFCELNCRRRDVNEAVSIRELKKYAGEHDSGLWKKNKKPASPTGRKVAVIGAGPAGLTGAYYLAGKGHAVTVFERAALPGGMLQLGIPAYRLPRDVVDSEIDDIRQSGIHIETGVEIRSLDDLFEKGYSAILVATGTHKGVRLPIEGCNLKGVLVNTDFLREISLKQRTQVGRSVLVLGGGNVAFDCARSARRLGAEKVTMACLEGRTNMTAGMDEIEQALEEGIEIVNSQTFHKIVPLDGMLGVVCSDVASFRFDENKRLKLELVPDSEHVLPAETVIFAVGQTTDLPPEFGLKTGRGNCAVVDAYRTSWEGVFAAGDVVTGTSSVVQAIAGARGAASAIDRFLGGDGDITETLAPVEEPSAHIGKFEGFACFPRQAPHEGDPSVRVKSFQAYDEAFSDREAHCEAERCMQCDLRLRMQKVQFWGDYAHK